MSPATARALPIALAAPPPPPSPSLLATLAASLVEDAARHDREASFPFESIEKLRRAGLLRLTVPLEFGGGGAGLLVARRAVQAIGTGCPATALILAMQLSKQAALGRNRRWPAHLRARVLRDAVEEGGLMNTLRVEPELGSPTRGGLPATIARRTATGWAITGRKIYSTGAPGLRWMEVFARTDEASPRIGSFLVPAGVPGLSIEPTWNALGLRGSGSHDVVLQDVTVPEDHAVDLRDLGPPERDPESAAWNAQLVSAVYLGVAEAARGWIIGFVRQRAPGSLGAPLATLARVQEAIGRIEGRLLVARLAADAAAQAVDEGRTPPATESGLLKVALAEAAIGAVQEAIHLAGNHGQSRDNPLERHWRDVGCAAVHVPTNDAAHEAAGRTAIATAAGKH